MSRRLLVSGVGSSITKEELKLHFSSFGSLSECKLQVDSTGESRGFAFLTYSEDDSLHKCLEETSHRVNGRFLSVSKVVDENADSHSSVSICSKKLLISFIGVPSVTETTLRDAFEEYGPVTEVYFPEPVNGSTFLPYCLVTFAHETSVDECMKKQHCLNGRSVFVRKAIRKEHVKRAEQTARERADREERSKHGYAGYSSSARPPSETPQFFSSMPSLLAGCATVSQSTETQPYADYGGYANYYKYEESVRSGRAGQLAYSQASFHSAYNYSASNISSMAGYGSGDHVDPSSNAQETPDETNPLKGYGYV